MSNEPIFPELNEPARYGTRRIPVVALGLSLSNFFATTYVLCVLFDLWVPEFAMNSAWGTFLPGFEWLSWSSFALGLVEALAYGWYIALVFGPLYNYFVTRSAWPQNTN